MPHNLKDVYLSIKTAIDDRLGEFRALWENGTDADVFREMCFCTCTPQNNAHKAWDAVCALDGLIETAQADRIAAVLREGGVRFHRNKARYITANRESFFPDAKARIAAILKDRTQREARDILAERVYGWGLKEASHFLRNIGFGSEVCILDRHILRQLSLHGVFSQETSTVCLTKSVYRDVEARMALFAAQEGIPVDALDLTFWFAEKGALFK
ncbi:MAG: N-glycosylase/DNA lyase [Treponema sp.]|jgi:N-glycosylase/DNA lyase|nr:N-glycosylase/DNA lyase [Treponema sp.]